MAEPILEVRDLRVQFDSDFGSRTVTDDISFSVAAGETLGIVGESGCGKSVTSLAVMGLLARNGHVAGGEAVFCGQDLLHLPEAELDEVRGRDIAMIFQDALASLDPVFPVGRQIEEVLRRHLHLGKKEARARAAELLAMVGLPDAPRTMKKYPHELSGGMRQRVMIAMALSCKPRLLIADEPTTALDVTIQAQIMRQLRELKAQLDMSMLLITHDIGLVAQMADRVLVMYAGQIIEEAPVAALFASPAHPYTQALLAAAPGIDDAKDRTLAAIKGTVPENYTDLVGCRFADRCPHAAAACGAPQAMRDLGGGHFARCRLAEARAAEAGGAGTSERHAHRAGEKGRAAGAEQEGGAGT